MSPVVSSLKDDIKDYALSLGFDLVGVASVDNFDEHEAIALDRIHAGFMEGLPWYTEARVTRGCNPEELLPGARSIIAVGMSYHVGGHHGGSGKVARYAWGDDYHNVMKGRLKSFIGGLGQVIGRQIKARWYVDDGPMLDRAVAERAGIGWFGKNTNILSSSHGSWILLGEVITDLELEPDQPSRKTCGECVKCIVDCPTGAIVAPYVIDNAKCISYLTIENRGPIPLKLRPLIGNWVFGCDICQDVCPVNRKALPSLEKRFARRETSVLDLATILEMDEEDFQRRFQGSPIRRAKLVGLQRNACVGLGNSKDSSAVKALLLGLKNTQALVRSHAAWGLGRWGTPTAVQALRRALDSEQDGQVVSEIKAALGQTDM